MGILEGLISPGLTQVAKARGAYLSGQRQAEQEGIANAIAQMKAKREAESAAILDALHKAQTEKALRLPPVTPEPNNVVIGPDGKRTYAPRSKAVGMEAPEPPEPTNVVIGPDGKPVYATRAASVGKEAPPKSTASTEVVVQGASGGPVIVDKKAGTSREVTAPAGGDRLHMQPPGAVVTAHVENIKRKSNIADALDKLKAHPSAVGLLRGVPDDVNQRVDPEGVPARAALADIGSLIIHDRSGAAVTVSEYPRLKPFVPKVTDTYDTVVKKLNRMAEIIDEENLAMMTAYPALKSGAPPGDDPEFAALMAKYKTP